MKQVIIIALTLFAFTSCNIFNSDDDDDNGGTPPPVETEADVSIEDVSAPDLIIAGNTEDIEVTLDNLGEVAVTDSITITVTDETDDVVISSHTIHGEMLEEEDYTFNFEWDTEEASIGEHTIVVSHTYDDADEENNSYSFTTTIGEPQALDVAITDIEAPESVVTGNEATIDVTLQNAGQDDITDVITVTLSSETDGSTIDTQTIEGFASGEEETLSFTWNSSDLAVGEHELVVTHDFEDDNTDNNTQSVVIDITEQQQSDITISAINAPDAVNIGDEAQVEVTVQNNGDENVTDDIVVTLSDEDDGEIATQTVEGLDAGDETTLTFDWNTEGVSAGDRTLTATHNFADGDETNNSQSTTVTVNEATAANNDVEVSFANAPTSVAVGDDATFEVTLANNGDENITEDITLSLVNDADETTIGTEVVNGLDSGSETTVTFTWTTAGEVAGDYDITVSHDVDDDNADNNSATTSITVGDETATVDTDVSITITNPYTTGSPLIVTQGDTAFVEVELENLGTVDVTEDFTVRLLHHNIEESETVTISGLAAGETTTVSLHWATQDQSTGAPPHPIDLVHDLNDNNADNNTDRTFIQVDPEAVAAE